MRQKGKVWKDGKFWLIQVPSLNAMTQGFTKKEAYAMIKEFIELQVESYLNKKINIVVLPLNRESFEVSSDDAVTLFAFLLRMLRVNEGNTIDSIKEKLNFKSANSYQAYEYGNREPSLSKMEELLKALNPKAKIVIEV